MKLQPQMKKCIRQLTLCYGYFGITLDKQETRLEVLCESVPNTKNL